MGKPLPIELRQRVVSVVAEGHSHRSASAQFRVSVKFVNDMVLLKRATGALEPKPQGNGGGFGKLSGVAGRRTASRSAALAWPRTDTQKRPSRRRAEAA